MKIKIKVGLMVVGLLGAFGSSQAVTAIDIPREKITLRCADEYFKSIRENFLLEDEKYSSCVLRLPLSLKQTWKNAQRFYILPRVGVELVSLNDKEQPPKTRSQPLGQFGNPGSDSFHRLIPAKGYKSIDLVTKFTGSLDQQVSADFRAKALGITGKLSICADPVALGEDPCLTYNVIARFEIYHH
jgi:hypothetical protein